MTTFYMNCPVCGTDVPPRCHCGSCGAFAMSKKLYQKLWAVAEQPEQPDGREFVARSKLMDELLDLGFVLWSDEARKFVVTESGMRTLAKAR